MQTDQKCPRCGADLFWIAPNSKWLGHNECRECFLAYHYEIETVKVSKTRARRYFRRAVTRLEQGMIPREKIPL